MDVATIGDTPIVYALFRHPNLRIIATISESTRDEKVIARKSAGITKPGDLAGKKIGVFFGTAAEFYLSRFLAAYGLSLKDVTLINLNGPDLVSALVRGDIDAFASWEPHVTNAKRRLNEDVVVFVNESIYTQTWNLVVRDDFQKKNPELIQRILKATIRSVSYLRQNQDESIAITAAQLSIDPSIVRAVWSDFDFGVELNETLIESLERQGVWIKDTGKITDPIEAVDYRSIILAGPLASLLPNAVRLR